MGAKWAIAVVFFVLISGNSAATEDIPLGSPADEHWRYQGESSELMSKATAGDTMAMVALGCSILDSNPPDTGKREALHWFGQAMDQGQPNAIFVIALLGQVGAIRLDTVNRIFVASLFDDYLAYQWADRIEPGRIPYFVAEMASLPIAQRDQVRLLRSQYRQRKIRFDDLQIVPLQSAADWKIACHTGI